MRKEFLSLACCAIICFLCLSCNEQKKLSSDVITIELSDDQPIPNGQNIKVKGIDVINLELTDNSQISDIKQLQLYDSVFYVLDNNALMAFSYEGKYLRTYGMKGRAENEFINLSCFFIDPSQKSIGLFDSYQKKIVLFDINDGHYINVVRFDETFPQTMPYSITYVNDSTLFLCEQIYKSNNTIISMINTKSKQYKSILDVPLKTVDASAFVGQHSISEYGDQMLSVKPFDRGIYLLNSEGDFKLKYYIKDNKPNIKVPQLEEIEDFNLSYYLDFFNDGYFSGFSGIFETDDLIFLPFYGLHYYIINKQTNEITMYNDNINGTIESLPLFNIVSSSNNSLIGVVPYFRTFSLKKCSIGNDSSSEIKEFFDMINNMKPNDNPSLIVYRFPDE